MKPPRPAGPQAGGRLAFVPRFFSNFKLGSPVGPNMGCSQGQEADKKQTRSRGKAGSRRADRKRTGESRSLLPAPALQSPIAAPPPTAVSRD